ncbi:MAG: 1-(5-phosphoribosyl)-5-((5-phosphoribosylamino)methylideneamino)imidazole-4-carboxamide isomerase, partial [Firmicutes bacterium]|nr:1-(5-phosphoribosyl)-5-((5-phosphoribosylamino)methylideneamino)imidazole-4-carboxamide isomerase [Bacillota bacterium]
GVSSLEAVQQAAAYADQGIRGVIIGRALYDGRMDLKAAISSVQDI